MYSWCTRRATFSSRTYMPFAIFSLFLCITFLYIHLHCLPTPHTSTRFNWNIHSVLQLHPLAFFSHLALAPTNAWLCRAPDVPACYPPATPKFTGWPLLPYVNNHVALHTLSLRDLNTPHCTTYRVLTCYTWAERTHSFYHAFVPSAWNIALLPASHDLALTSAHHVYLPLLRGFVVHLPSTPPASPQPHACSWYSTTGFACGFSTGGGYKAGLGCAFFMCAAGG